MQEITEFKYLNWVESLLQNLEVKVVGEESPFSTAILSDGRIVVCEFNNNRIQVFEHTWNNL